MCDANCTETRREMTVKKQPSSSTNTHTNTKTGNIHAREKRERRKKVSRVYGKLNARIYDLHYYPLPSMVEHT